MKKNNIKFTEWLFNPFRYIAGVKALLIGLLVLFALSILGFLSNTHFDGVIDVHYGCLAVPTSYKVHASYQLINGLLLTFVLYIAALICSTSSVRLIDIAGTLALARIPFIFFALFGFIPSFHLCFDPSKSVDIEVLTNILHNNLLTIIVIAMLSIVLIGWAVVLMYNAFSVSANLKGAKGIITFIVALCIAEILSKIIIYKTL